MGRPKNPSMKTQNATADGDPLRNSIDAAELRSLIERVENVNDGIARLTEDRKEIFAEIKGAGYDAATVRTIIKRRAMDPDKRYTVDQLLDLYMTALGDFAETPLGQAGAERIRGGEVRV
jgi:uncharacterized protein (UPF0335 family)